MRQRLRIEWAALLWLDGHTASADEAWAVAHGLSDMGEALRAIGGAWAELQRSRGAA